MNQPMDIRRFVSIPFAAKPINPATPWTQEPTIDWLRKLRLLASPKAVQQYGAMHFERLNGFAYPTHMGDGLRLGNDTMGWFFIFDDQFDGPLGNDPAQVERIIEEMTAVLADDAPAVPQTSASLVRGFQDLWRRSCSGMSDGWRARMRESWVRYLQSYRWEAESRRRGKHPGLSEYLENRRNSIGIPSAVILAERIQGFELSPAAAELPEADRLMALTGEQVALVNDLFSVHKEIAEGDTQNSVIILRASSACSLETAYRQVAGMIEARHMEFQEITRHLPSSCAARGFGSEEIAALLRHVDSMRDWMHANLAWSLETARYSSVGVNWAKQGRPWHDLLARPGQRLAGAFAAARA